MLRIATQSDDHYRYDLLLHVVLRPVNENFRCQFIDSVIVFEHIGYQKVFKDINKDTKNNILIYGATEARRAEGAKRLKNYF